MGWQELCEARTRRQLRQLGASIPLWSLAAVLLAGLAVGDLGAEPNAVQERFQAAQAAMQSGRFAEAEIEYRAVLEATSDLPEARVNLGLVLFLQGKYAETVAQLERVAAAEPDLPVAHLFLGLGHLKLGAAAKAVAPLERSLRHDPANLEARRALAACHLALADYAAAVREFQAAFAHNPDKAEAWHLLGRDYMGLMSDFAGRLVVRTPDSIWASRLAADMLVLSEAWDAAAGYYATAIAKSRGLPGLHAALGAALLRQGSLDDAATQFQAELEIDARSEQALLGLAEVSLAHGDAAAALQHVSAVWDSFPQGLLSGPGFPVRSIDLGHAAALQPALAQAEGGAASFLRWALFGAARNMAQAAAERLRFESALQTVATRAAGQSPAAELCREHLYAACAQALESRRSLTRGELLLLGQAYLALGRREGALVAFTHAMTGAAGELPEALYWTVRTLQSLADQCFQQVGLLAPGSWRVHQLRAEAHRQRQADDEAIAEYRTALEIKPDEAELHRSLGLIYLLNNAYDDAQRALERALELDGANPRTLYFAGRLFVAKQQHAESIGFLETALRLDPNLVEARPRLGRAYLRVGRYEEAVAQLERGLVLDYYGDIHYSLFQAHRSLGNRERAQEALERSTEMRKRSFARDRGRLDPWIRGE